MNVRFLFAIALSLMPALGGCRKTTNSRNHDRIEDLVLIEFAARLEDDYHKIHPEASHYYTPPHSSVQVPSPEATPANPAAPNPVVPNPVEPERR